MKKRAITANTKTRNDLVWKMMQFYKHESRLRVYYRGKHEELPGEVIYECHGIHYLHELQNAFYMATGEELEVKL